MKRFPFIAFFLIVCCLAAATFLEKGFGTEFANSQIYSSTWFVLSWAFLVVSAIIYLIKKTVYKNGAAFTLHISFVVILAGALLTATTGSKGYIHLRENEQKNIFTKEQGKGTGDLPFSIRLDTFQIRYYKGTKAPADYISKITVTDGDTIRATLSMNNIFSYRGFRFYQTSFDEDLRGSVLSVNHDEAGIAVTYSGYLLLFVSMLWTLVSRKGRFRMLLKQLRSKQLTVTGIFLLFSAVHLYGAQTPEKEVCGELDKIQILYNDRIVPFETFARDFTSKLTGKSHYGKYSAGEFLSGWIFFPQQWQYEPIIEIKNGELRTLLGINGKRAAFTDFFTSDKQYKLAGYQQEILKNGKLPPFLKAVSEANEKIQLVYMLQSGELLSVFPYIHNDVPEWYTPVSRLPEDLPENDRLFIRNTFSLLYEPIVESDKKQALFIIGKIKEYQKKQAGDFLPSPTRLKAEILYNQTDIPSLLFKFNLLTGCIAFLFYCFRFTRRYANDGLPGCGDSNSTGLRCSKNTGIFPGGLLTLCTSVSFLFLSAYMGLRSYISGRFPFSNGFETMLFTAWCVLLTALILHKKLPLIQTMGLLLSGFILLVASLGKMNPQITPLVPVLSSPWLSIHVSLVMMSYALFGFILFNSLTAIILLLPARKPERGEAVLNEIKRLATLNRLFLYPGVFFLGAGIFTGAVWANLSWGRYWAWDPKEVWALITFMVYSFAFHDLSIRFLRDSFAFHCYMIGSFGCVLMTYFGVNYFLGGMHSYAGEGSAGGIGIAGGAAVLLIGMLFIGGYKKYRKLLRS